MRALGLVGARRLEIVSLPDERPPGPDEVTVRIRAVGICGTDLHYYRGEDTGQPLPLPFVMGHELAGEIEMLGAGVSGLRVGDHVAIDPAVACGRCEACLDGHPHVCTRGHFVGAPGLAGGLRERIVHPARLVHRLGSVGLISGAVLEPLGVALHATDLAGLRLADTVAVLGAGPIGLVLVQLARLAGAQLVLATDVLDHRVRLAKRHGAHEAIDASRQDPVDAILEATGGRGVDVAFEVAGAAATADQAAAVTRPLGTVVVVGICADDQITFRAAVTRRKGLTIKVSRRMKHVYPRTLALVERGMIALDPLVSHTLPLERGGEAFAMAADYADGVAKVVIVSD